jgi:hypothetical protein
MRAAPAEEGNVPAACRAAAPLLSLVALDRVAIAELVASIDPASLAAAASPPRAPLRFDTLRAASNFAMFASLVNVGRLRARCPSPRLCSPVVFIVIIIIWQF